MTKHRQILEGNPIPQDFLDSFQEFIGSYISPNFSVVIVGGTTLRVPAGADNAQVSAAINGAWRYISANADGAAPGGLVVGENPIFICAAVNAFSTNPSPPPRELDSTTYGFTVVPLPAGNLPSGSGGQALYRQVGTATWNGTAFTAVTLTAFPQAPASLSRGEAIFLG